MALNPNNIIMGAASVLIDGTDVGYTVGGTDVKYGPSFTDIKGDQAVGTIKKFRNDETMSVTVRFSEITLLILQQAFNLPASALTASTLTLGYNNACYIPEHTMTLIGVGPNCRTRTFNIFRAVAMSDFTYAMSRENQTVLEVEFECLKNVSGNFATIVDS